MTQQTAARSAWRGGGLLGSNERTRYILESGRSRAALPRRLLLSILLSIFVSEILVMGILGLMPGFSPITEAILDGLLVTGITVPVLYFLSYRPFVLHLKRLQTAENELLKIAAFVEQADEAIFITDTNGTIEYVSPGFERITGYRGYEVLGKNPRLLKSGKHDDTYYQRMWDTISSGKVWKGRITNRRKSGELYDELITITPILDEAGNVMNFVAINQDVTNEVKLDQQIRQSQKIEAIGTLAGGIAHDFNNILSAIIGYTEMTLDELDKDGELHENLSEALRASYRAKDLVRQILTFSRRGESELKPLQIQLIVKESLKLLRATLPVEIEIVSRIEYQTPPVLADPTQISQVMMNLCANAAHSMMPHGGVMTVDLRTVTVERPLVGINTELPPGSYARLSVADAGHGMSAAVAERIFEPFYTTKDVGEGTGLGLAAVLGIVTSHGGAIQLDTAPGKGTSFDIYFPVVGSPPPSTVSAAGSVPTRHGNERILLIDDEERLARMLERGLTRLGYQVTATTDPGEAVRLIGEQDTPFDLLVCDHTDPLDIPHPLLPAIRKEAPGLPIVMLSGYEQRGIRRSYPPGVVQGHLVKPVAIHDLAQEIRRVLGAETGPSAPAARPSREE